MIFIFFFSAADCHECSRGWGDGGARDCERGLKIDLASLPTVQVLNIFVFLYTVYFVV